MITFDLETTGFEPHRDEIIEVGFALYDDQFNEQCRDGCLVSPTQTIPDDVVSLTGITNEEAQEEGHPWKAVRRELRPLFEEHTVWCAHNADFDISFLEAHFETMPSRDGVLDTMRLSERFLPCDNQLADVAQFYGVSLQNAHRAVEDAAATADVLTCIMDDLDLSVDDVLEDDPVKLGKYHYHEDPFEALYSGLSDRQN